MNPTFRRLIILFICCIPFSVVAQETKAKEAPANSRAKRKIAKQKWKEQRKADRDHKKAVKAHHQSLQSKKTRKQMRAEKRKSDKFNTNRRDFFLVRWFKYRN